MTSRMNKILTGLTALVAIAGIALVLSGAGTTITTGTARSAIPTVESHYVPPNPPPNADVPIPRFGTTHTVAAASEGAGFNWSAAAIGALASAGACAVLIGLALNVRRRHEPKPV